MEYEFLLNNISDEQYQPNEIESLNIVATFDNENIQPNISISEVELLSKARKDILNYINGGLTGATPGIFEGIPYEIKLKQYAQQYSAFKAMIDFTEEHKINDTSIICKFKSNDGLNNLTEQSQALTYGYLENIGKLKNSDYIPIPYVINHIPDAMQLLMLSITIYLINKELQETVPKIPEHIQAVITAATPTVGLGATIDIGNVIIQAVKLALLLAWVAFMYVAIYKMITQLIESIYSDVRYHKGVRLEKLIIIAAQHLNLTFKSSLFTGKYKNLVLLPIKNRKGQPGINGSKPEYSGCPSSGSYGYTFFEVLELTKKLFNAKILIKDGDLIIESLQNTQFWEKNSTYQIPDVEKLTYRYNTDELTGTLLLKFETDISDLNTIDNFTGTNYERLTTPKTVKEQKNITIKNIQEINFNVALGTRKEKLTIVEKTLKVVLDIADVLTVGKFALASKMKNSRIGALSLSSDNFNVAKLILTDSNNKLAANQRALVSAKAFYLDYYPVNSFVANNYNSQYRIYEDITIPFGFSDFLKVISNSYCYNNNGVMQKIDKLLWNFTEDFAVISYREKEIYTKNLKETFIEA